MSSFEDIISGKSCYMFKNRYSSRIAFKCLIFNIRVIEKIIHAQTADPPVHIIATKVTALASEWCSDKCVWLSCGRSWVRAQAWSHCFPAGYTRFWVGV